MANLATTFFSSEAELEIVGSYCWYNKLGICLQVMGKDSPDLRGGPLTFAIVFFYCRAQISSQFPAFVAVETQWLVRIYGARLLRYAAVARARQQCWGNTRGRYFRARP